MSGKTYEQRASSHSTVLGRKLLSIIAAKRSNLCLSADVTDCESLLSLADRCGPYICLLKTHIDILTDFTPAFTRSLRHLAAKHNFLIFEDRKFADIGSTVQHQYRDGIYKISSWADIINAHTVPGEGIIAGLQGVAEEHQDDPIDRGLLLLAQMSSKGNLFSEEYTQASLDMARRHKDFVMGFIAMGRLQGMRKNESDNDEDDFIIMTPGVSLASKGDALGQQYQTPESVIGERGSDVIIVGRGIFGAGENVEEVAQEYREKGWEAYKKRIGS